jgi:hypothetical protein
MEKMSFLLYGYRTNHRKTPSGDVADTGLWPAGPAASSAQSGGQPTGWVFSLPHSLGRSSLLLPPSLPPNLSLISNSLVSLWSGGKGKKGRKTEKKEEKEEGKEEEEEEKKWVWEEWVLRVTEREKKNKIT